MITTELNQRFGRQLFAHNVDEYGIPRDGWSRPHTAITADPDNRRYSVTVGTFRSGPHNTFERVLKQSYVATKDVEAAGTNQPLRDCADRLLVELVESLPDKE